MGAKNARGVWVPAAGDGLLEGWATAAKQGGMYLPVASVAAARTALGFFCPHGLVISFRLLALYHTQFFFAIYSIYFLRCFVRYVCSTLQNRPLF